MAHPLRGRALYRFAALSLRLSPSGDDPCAEAGSQGGCATLPEEARLRPAWQSNTAALRLGASLVVCWLKPAEGAAARLFHWAGCFTVPLSFSRLR